MKQFLTTLLFIVIIDLTFQNCANPGRPTGGPQDTIPPVLIYANPVSGTTNFSGTTIELEFDEYVNADKLQQQLIISPNTDLIYKSIVKRNKLIIKLEGELKDSTTYNFNFANGVTDITEKNPAVNLSIAVSTGHYIDSMSVEGSVQELLSQEPAKEYVVGLYELTDSLDFLRDKPKYFATADEFGNYKLNYIKTGNYKIIAFNDDNGNFLLDPNTEAHGFLSDTIVLDSATTLRPIRTLLQNVKPLALINVRPVGNYVEAKFNKNVDQYSINPNLPSNIVGENNDIIRIYKPETINYRDSVSMYIQASDSLGNATLDTVKYVFLESNRKPSTFSYSFSHTKIELVDNPFASFIFNKPILNFDSAAIQITADSLLTYSPSFTYDWNFNKTQLDINLTISVSVLDSLSETLLPDTTQTDTAALLTKASIPQLSLTANKAAFISVESDTSTMKSIPFVEPTTKSSGVLKVDLQTELTHFTFQLLNSNDQVVYQKTNTSNFTLSAVKPDKYKIRVLIDNNKDGEWSYGNLMNNQEPEEVFIYEKTTSIRENWVVELSITL